MPHHQGMAKPFLCETHRDNIKKPSLGPSANVGHSHRDLSSTAFSPGCLQPEDGSEKLNLPPYSLSVITPPLCSTVYNKHVSLLGMGWEGLWLFHSTTQILRLCVLVVYWVFSVCHFSIFLTPWRKLQGPGHVCAALKQGSKPMEGRQGDWGTGPWKRWEAKAIPRMTGKKSKETDAQPAQARTHQNKRDDGEALGKCCQKERETSSTVCLSTLMGGMLLQSAKALRWISDYWTDILKSVCVRVFG